MPETTEAMSALFLSVENLTFHRRRFAGLPPKMRRSPRCLPVPGAAMPRDRASRHRCEGAATFRDAVCASWAVTRSFVASIDRPTFSGRVLAMFRNSIDGFFRFCPQRSDRIGRCRKNPQREDFSLFQGNGIFGGSVLKKHDRQNRAVTRLARKIPVFGG